MTNWQLQHDEIPESIDEVQQILLENRGISDIKEFLHVTPPQKLSLEEVAINSEQIEAAVSRIKTAINDQEKILIFGDYDADGICATAILWLTLHHMGAQVLPFIPHREQHGYGVSDAAIDEIVSSKDKPNLIITVDNGIVAHAPVRRLADDEGIDVIITDHHQPESTNNENIFPPAQSIIHTTKLCGAGVSWMLARELDEKFAISQLDLVGIATIADQVPLIGANRSFAKFGLDAVQNSKRVGLNKLFKAASLDKKSVSSGTIGFGIAPRINAMGRLKHGLDALRLLCTNNENQAEKLSKVLMKTNIERQDLTNELLSDAVIQAEEQREQNIIIVSSEDFHEGVVGLIAGRLLEKFYKPAIAVSIGGETAKASARSVAGVNIVEILREIQDDLLEVGGHPLAAGFSVETKKLSLISEKLFSLTQEKINKELLIPGLTIDTEIPWNLVGDELVEMTEQLAPFGQANRRPLFLLNDMKILSVRTMGSENNHLKLVLGSPDLDDPIQSTKTLNVLAWRKGELAQDFKEGDAVSVVGMLEFNHWNGKTSVQMIMKDIKKQTPD